MPLPNEGQRRRIEAELNRCADFVFQEITRNGLRPEDWYLWYLCERLGGAPLIDARMPHRQIAYWDGEDIVVDAHASVSEVAEALPEELAHRLCSRETPRFEPLNYLLRHVQLLDRPAFQELVGQRVAARFAALRTCRS